MINYIVWSFSGNLAIGNFSIHLYSFCFALGLLLGGFVVIRLMQEYKTSQTYLIYAFLGIFLGARLGHCLLYEPNYYLNHIAEIFLPYQKIDGEVTFTGFSGLASHVGVLGLMLALAIFAYRNKVDYLRLCDVFAIATPLAGGFIRLGNLMNSEILGKATEVPLAFVFTRVDLTPRHPAQLYEAIWYFLLFLAIWLLYKKIGLKKYRGGFFLGVAFIGVAVFRFLVEFLKEPQELYQHSMPLNMGQLLSIPFIFAGIALIIYSIKRENS